MQVILYVLVFLAELVVGATVRGKNARQWSLLVGSCIVYLTWTQWFFLVLLASIAMNYLLGQWVRRKPTGLVLWLSVVLNLSLLATFKYLPELRPDLPFPAAQAFTHLALPLGMSFWTFQAMSYLFDLYRGEELDPTLVEFALYMAFFPVSIAGPLCRVPEMLPQFRSQTAVPASDRKHGFTRIAIGVLMMLLGKLLGQGILAGDGINTGFDRLIGWSGPDVWCLAIGFGLQLFFDFAGYSHIAIGTAKMLGISVPENFSRPFSSTTPSIFWTRWHMSLSFWIRDYVFLPLATLRRELLWRNLALILSMVLFGLWHRASVMFVLWGGYHGVLLVAHRQIQQLRKRFEWLPPGQWYQISWIVTTAFVSLGWIFFRAPSLPKASAMMSAVVSLPTYSFRYLSTSLYLLVASLALGYAAVLRVKDSLDRSMEAFETTDIPSGMMTSLARGRGYWVPPLYLLFLVAVLMVTLTQSPTTTQLMYRSF